MSIPEPKSRPAHAARAFEAPGGQADGVFLTPRVLDQGAFREYSESLRGLIREANGKRTDLRTDADDARQLCENLTTTASRLRERLETTAKLLPTLDDRVRRAERLLDAAAERSDLPQRVEQILATGIEEMEKRVEAAIARAEDRLRHVEARYDRVRQESEQSVSALESLKGRLDEAAAMATATLDRVNRDAHAAEAEARAQAERRASLMEQQAAGAERRTVEACDAAIERVELCLADAERHLAPLAERAEELRERLGREVEEAVRSLGAATADTVKKIHAVELIARRAVGLLGFDPASPGDDIAPDSLMMLVQRGDDMERQARQTARELGELHEVSERVCGELRSCVLGTTQTLETYRRRGGDLIVDLERAIAPVCEQNAALLEQILAARDLLADLDSQHEGTDRRVAETRERVLADLAGLRERAAAELEAVRGAIAAQRRALDRPGPGSSDDDANSAQP